MRSEVPTREAGDGGEHLHGTRSFVIDDAPVSTPATSIVDTHDFTAGPVLSALTGVDSAEFDVSKGGASQVEVTRICSGPVTMGSSALLRLGRDKRDAVE